MLFCCKCEKCLKWAGHPSCFLPRDIYEGNYLLILCSKLKINSGLNLYTNIFEKCQEKLMLKCTCFWLSDACCLHGDMFPLTTPRFFLQARKSLSLFNVASRTFSTPLAFLGQTHLIDQEAPSPWEIGLFQLCTIITSFPNDYFLTLGLWVCVIMMDRNFVTVIR